MRERERDNMTRARCEHLSLEVETQPKTAPDFHTFSSDIYYSLLCASTVLRARHCAQG